MNSDSQILRSCHRWSLFDHLPTVSHLQLYVKAERVSSIHILYAQVAAGCWLLLIMCHRATLLLRELKQAARCPARRPLKCF